MILDIVKGEDKDVLRQKATKINGISAEVKKLAKNMIDTMEKVNGLGIAAPQVGVSKRIVIVRLNSGTKNESVVAMINPEIIEWSEETDIKEEGCLSLPDLYLNVRRHTGIKLKFTAVSGDTQIFKLEGMNARVVQHEIDHLDGILIVDIAIEDDVMMV